MRKTTTKLLALCALVCGTLWAKADDANTDSLADSLKKLDTALKKVEAVEASPSAATPPDFATCGADLGGVAEILRRLQSNLASPTLATDLGVLQAKVATVQADVAAFQTGDPTGDFADIGRNFKYCLADLGTLLSVDLKAGNTIQTAPSLSADLGALADDLKILAPGLPEAGQARLSDLGAHGTNNSWGSIFLWVGARLDNPYSISTPTNSPTGTLKSGNSTTDGYVGFNVNLRYIFRADRYEDEYWSKKPAFWSNYNGHLQLYKPWALAPDIDFSFGYAFTASSAPSIPHPPLPAAAIFHWTLPSVFPCFVINPRPSTILTC